MYKRIHQWALVSLLMAEHFESMQVYVAPLPHSEHYFSRFEPSITCCGSVVYVKPDFILNHKNVTRVHLRYAEFYGQIYFTKTLRLLVSWVHSPLITPILISVLASGV